MKKYVMVAHLCSPNPVRAVQSLTEDVNKLIRSGFDPQGGVTMAVSKDVNGCDIVSVMQAMVRDEQ